MTGSVAVQRTQLLQQAVRGEWVALEQTLNVLREGGPEISQVDEDLDLSLLMIAAQESRLSIVVRLLELKVSTEDKTKDGRTALHIAVAHSKVTEIVTVLAERTDPNTPGGPKAQLPLHYAASRPDGSISVIQTLLKLSNRDARLTPDKDGYIPLLLAVKAGNIGIVKELLSDLSEPQLQAKTIGTGDMALHICCRRKDIDIARVLLEFNANSDSQNNEGQTPLHIAAWEGDQAMMNLFYHKTANLNIADKLDRCPLHIAAERGHSSVVEILTEKFTSNLMERTKDGDTLLHIASEHGYTQMALTFLQRGVPLHMPNKSGAVCLHSAAKCGHADLIQTLILNGAQVDASTKDGLTPLHIAAENCKPHVVQILLGLGAQVHLRGGKALETPLHISARVKMGEKVAEILLKSGADVNTETENGETAMHVAARHGSLQVMKALVEEGADLTWRSKAEDTPLHVAVRYCHADMVKAILNYLTSKRSREAAELCVRQENKKGETTLHLAAEIEKDIVHRDDEDVLIIRTLMEYKADVTAPTRQTRETPIHYCARVGNAAVLQEMLNNVPSNNLQRAINKQDKTGRSPLMLAAEQGHAEVMNLLLHSSASVDVFDEEGKSALHLAAEQGRKDIADILLSNKAFVNAKNKLALTPLHLSAQNGSPHLVQLLIKSHQACIDALSLNKQTPLHLAAFNGQLDVCNSLLNLGADITATDIHGQTPLHLAAENDHSDIVKLFLKHRPELATLANGEGATCINIAAAKGSVAVTRELLEFNQGDVTMLDNKHNGSCPLHLAAARGHTEVVKVLLEAGASTTEEDLEGMTAVHLAAQNGHIHILEVLKASASLNLYSSKTGLTALHVAACYGQVDFVREMLSKVPATICSQPPSRDNTMKHQPLTESEYTPLHLAAMSGHENVARLLLNSPGVLAEAETNPECFTPLHLAAQSGHTAVVRLLLSRSSSLMQLQDQCGRTCLHLASAHGQVDTVRTLLCHGADINHADKMGWTPLHYAAKAGWLEVVQILVESGASVKAECVVGCTPLQYAAKENHLTTLSFLLQQPDNNIVRLLKNRKFVFDLMVCGRLNGNIALDELVLYSAAPLATAMRLSRALSLTALKEKGRFLDLQNAACHCETMASDLLNLASTTEDMDAGVVLRAVDYRGTSMLDRLIEGRQKHVAALPAVQEYLTDVWYGNMQWASWKILLLFFGLLICYPLWPAISHLLKFRFNIPVVKYMSHLVSHVFLLALFIFTVVYPVSLPSESPLIPTWVEWFLLIWLGGMLLAEFHQTAERIGLAWIRVFLLIFSVAAVFCHLLAVCIQFQPQPTLNSLFARHVLLVFAMILGFIQLLEYLMFHHLIGPWAIIIKNQMKDLYRFAIILLLFHIAFSLSFTSICNPVRLAALQNFSNAETLSESENDTSSFVSLFFALFGLTDLEAIPCPKDSFAMEIGLANFVFGIFLVVTVVVLLNLLIAMLSNTYQLIQDHSDTEWKFGRAILVRDMSCKSDIPSPFNLFACLFFYVKSLCKQRGKLCSVERQDLRREEEEAEVLSETLSQSTTANTQSIRCFKGCRRTQILVKWNSTVTPQSGEQVHIEAVTDWSVVVQRFLALRAQKDSAPPA